MSLSTSHFYGPMPRSAKVSRMAAYALLSVALLYPIVTEVAAGLFTWLAVSMGDGGIMTMLGYWQVTLPPGKTFMSPVPFLGMCVLAAASTLWFTKDNRTAASGAWLPCTLCMFLAVSLAFAFFFTRYINFYHK